MSDDESSAPNTNGVDANSAAPPTEITEITEKPLQVEQPPSEPVKTEASSAPLITVVGFHHARGPEVESWFGVEDGFDPAVEYEWTLLPFMALSDGAHASEEDFSYFTLLRPESERGPATSLFGISCTRQLDSTQLIERPADVTRSTVQKAVVVITDTPQTFSMLRERLSIVTQAWFAQRDFTDVEILRGFQESLAEDKERDALQGDGGKDQYIGMSLRELIHEFKWQTLVLLKCCLLQPKMLFFGSRCDRLCMVQFSLISLIPGLIRGLQDCADPELNNYEKTLSQATSLQSSNRESLLRFMGLPLQIFGKGSLFGPYTPLQQLDVLADFGTKSYIVGSTNSLLLQQKDRYSDILINLDENTVNITSPSLRNALSLTTADRRWMDLLTQEINDTWDNDNPSQPNNRQYRSSEDDIRVQFEVYVLGLISSVKYHNFLVSHNDGGAFTEPSPAADYGMDFVEAWKRTENYRMWDGHTDYNLFSVKTPKHPAAGGLTMDDVQRRFSEQVKDLHLDERFAQGREVLERNFAAGRERAAGMLNRLYSDVEYLRESQRRRAEDAAAARAKDPNGSASEAGGIAPIDVAKAQQAAASVGSRASAYMSSWAAWAGEKRKGGGWSGGWGKKSSVPGSPRPGEDTGPIDRDYQMISAPGSRAPSSDVRPGTGVSFSESILSGASDSSGERPSTGAERASVAKENGHQNGRKQSLEEVGGGNEKMTTAAAAPATKATPVE